jgi:hypothetical protein
MPPKANPLGLNKLQLKTLTILQELARAGRGTGAPDADGSMRLTELPAPHGDHFHVGQAVVRAADATGLSNEGVWRALERKGLARSEYPLAVVVTAAGLAYETGLRHAVLHGGGH